jgi:hypothetical protein
MEDDTLFVLLRLYHNQLFSYTFFTTRLWNTRFRKAASAINSSGRIVLQYLLIQYNGDKCFIPWQIQWATE